MFGYHAARWVNANRLLANKKENPFAHLTKIAELKTGRRVRHGKA